ncbi:MAG TPA: hypothetical protein VIL74_18460 [Pyrinomonadaceae bacterium]|jgi:hypothetical protein
MRRLSIEGYLPEQILDLPDEEFEGLVFTGKPIVFHAGSAEVLGEFKLESAKLTIELAQIEGGGEGVLPIIVSLSRKYARKRNLTEIEWIVHALNCAKPNLKLRHVMERKGFIVKEIEGIGKAFYFLDKID